MADRKSHTTREASYPKQSKSGAVSVDIRTTPSGGGGTVDPKRITPSDSTATGLAELDGPRARGGKHD